MNLFNLDRFRFEKRSDVEEQNAPPSDSSTDQKAPIPFDTVKENSPIPSPSENHAIVGGEDDHDHTSGPTSPASDVSEKTDDSSIPETPETKRIVQSKYFKFKKDVIELSSESEHEEVRMKCSNTKQSSVSRKDVIIISEPSDDEGDNESSQSLHKNGPAEMSDTTEEEEEEDLNYCKLQTLKELFPQKTDQALLELIESTNTMDEAIAAGLKLVDEGGSRKRKLDEGAVNESEDKDDQSAKKKKLEPVSIWSYFL